MMAFVLGFMVIGLIAIMVSIGGSKKPDVTNDDYPIMNRVESQDEFH